MSKRSGRNISTWDTNKKFKRNAAGTKTWQLHGYGGGLVAACGYPNLGRASAIVIGRDVSRTYSSRFSIFIGQARLTVG